MPVINKGGYHPSKGPENPIPPGQRATKSGVSGEKKHSVLKVLGAVSGLGEAEARKIFEQVKENHAKLDACEEHDFVPHKRQGKLIRDYRCTRCGGVLDSINRSWYERGLEHGKDRM